jgi:pimeloyl-[acyl-carrier protein] synthase
VHFDMISRFWFVTAHAACAAALSDSRFSASLGQRERVRDDDLPASMLTSDAPDHARLRGPGALLLGPAALRSQDRAISEAASQVAGGLAGRDEADAATDIGEPFAVGVFASLFALSGADGAAFAGRGGRPRRGR